MAVFTLGKISYQFETGMTWAKWIGSKYDTTSGYTSLYADSTTNTVGNIDGSLQVEDSSLTPVKPSDTIVDGGAYSLLSSYTFTIDGVKYRTDEDNLHWEEWVYSSYNTDGFVCDTDNTTRYIFNANKGQVHDDGDMPVIQEDEIIKGCPYVIYGDPGYSISFDTDVVGFAGIIPDPSNAKRIYENGSVLLKFTVSDDRYIMPGSVTVTGAQSEWVYTSDTGTLSIYMPTSNVVIYLGAEQVYYNIDVDVNPEHISAIGDSASHISVHYGEVYLYFVASEGYALPDNINVTGASYHHWSPSDGTLYIRNAYKDITVSMKAKRTFPIDFTIGDATYKFIEDMTFEVWVNSEYNTDGFKFVGSMKRLYLPSTGQYVEDEAGNPIYNKDFIWEDEAYMLIDPITYDGDWWPIKPQTLVDIGNAIRAKKGTTDLIPVKSLASEIASITTGTPVSGTIDITESGLYDVATYEKANVQIELPQLNAPVATIEGDTLTIDSPTNGNFVTAYDIYVDGVLKETVSTAATLISFTIDGVSYQAEGGMTWDNWCDSQYNTANAAVLSGGTVYNSSKGTVQYQSSNVKSTDTINDGYAYSWYMESM